MTTPNVNHATYDERMNFVQKLISKQFQWTDATIDTIAYQANCPFPFNNFIYSVSLASPTKADDFKIEEAKDTKALPGTEPIPEGTTRLILRLTNAHPGTGLNQTNRVENEVAGLKFARAALAHTPYAHTVPSVYHWESAKNVEDTTPGWILMQHMDGIDGHTNDLNEMTTERQTKLINQVADIFAALKNHSFSNKPGTHGFGGLAFDSEGDIVLGEMTLLDGAPFKNALQMWQAMLDYALKDADQSPILAGWHDTDLRNRIDAYRQSGLREDLDSIDVDETPVYCPTDFGLNNMLIDPDTLDITAVLDLDWGYIGMQYDDYFRTLQTVQGAFPLGSNLEGEDADIQRNMLSGFAEIDSTTKDTHKVGRLWDAALEKRNVARPHTLKSTRELGDIKWFIDNIAPFQLVAPPMIERLGEQKVKAKREATQQSLEAWLDRRGH